MAVAMRKPRSNSGTVKDTGSDDAALASEDADKHSGDSGWGTQGDCRFTEPRIEVTPLLDGVRDMDQGNPHQRAGAIHMLKRLNMDAQWDSREMFHRDLAAPGMTLEVADSVDGSELGIAIRRGLHMTAIEDSDQRQVEWRRGKGHRCLEAGRRWMAPVQFLSLGLGYENQHDTLHSAALHVRERLRPDLPR